MSVTLLGQSILSGIFSGGLYALLGLGVTLAWRFLHVINLAHFAFVFLAAYLTYALVGAGLHPAAATALILPAFFGLGVAQQWVLLRFKVNEFASVIVTFGVTIVAEALIQWIWSPDFLRMETRFLHGSKSLGPFFLPWADAAMFAVAAAICVATWAVLRFTYLGKALRASIENPAIAASFGVPNQRLALLLAGGAGASAAVGGAFLALLFTLQPSQIYSWFGVVLAVVILGGLGSPLGVLAAGLLIGVSESVTMALTAPAWAPIVPFSLLILIVILWPQRI